MAAKKKAKKKPTIRQGDKAAFVRGLPRSMPASEVVDRALAKGMVISKAYVHNIRSAANKSARALLTRQGKRSIKGSRKSLEAQFRNLVIHLGPARAKKLLSQVELALRTSGKSKR